MELKDRIKSLRAERGISPAKLSSDFNKSESTIRMWELGKSKPSADDIIALARYFDCSTDYLFGLSDIRNQDMPISVKTIGLTTQNVDFIQNGLAKWQKGKGYPYTDKRTPADILNEILNCQNQVAALLEAVKAAIQAPSPIPPAVWEEGNTRKTFVKAVEQALQSIEQQEKIKNEATLAAKAALEAIIMSLTPEASIARLISQLNDIPDAILEQNEQ